MNIKDEFYILQIAYLYVSEVYGGICAVSPQLWYHGYKYYYGILDYSSKDT